MSIRLHPTFARLRGFARGDLDEPNRRRVARHLTGCARCRSEVARVRSILEAASADPTLPHGMLPAILERRAAGGRVILPAADGTVRAPRLGRLHRVAAIALILVAAAAAALIYTPALEADSSELHFTPERPTPGATITVTYRPTSRLADEPRLVLRARYRTAGHGRARSHAVLGTLEPDAAGTYVAQVELPDSIVYAVFVVENVDATFVDHNGERWELITHDEEGRPLFDALWQRYSDVQQRDLRIASDVAAEIVRLHPDRPEGLRAILFDDVSLASRAAADSVRRAHRERYLADVMHAIDAIPEPDVFQLAGMVFYANELADTATFERYRTLLYERYPLHQATVQRRTFDLVTAHRGDPDALMLAFDTLYRETGTGVQVGFSAFDLASRRERPDEMTLWGERFTAEDSTFAWFVATRYAAVPVLHDRAADLMRTAIERQTVYREADRPLTRTRDEFSATLRLTAGTMLTELGEVLLALGDTAAALDTLEVAFDAGWDPQRFRTIAALHLALDDTAAARAAIARVAADPTTREAADSLRRQLGEAASGDRWESAVATARSEMMTFIWQRAVDRSPLLPRLRLERPDGARETFELATGKPMVIAFWSRYCPPSYAQLAEMDRTLQRLIAEDVPVLSITDEDLAKVRPFLEQNGYGFPVYADPESDASRAFDRPGTPTYFVLDAEGRIRFESNHVSDVVRYVYAIRTAIS